MPLLGSRPGRPEWSGPFPWHRWLCHRLPSAFWGRGLFRRSRFFPFAGLPWRTRWRTRPPVRFPQSFSRPIPTPGQSWCRPPFSGGWIGRFPDRPLFPADLPGRRIGSPARAGISLPMMWEWWRWLHAGPGIRSAGGISIRNLFCTSLRMSNAAKPLP